MLGYPPQGADTPPGADPPGSRPPTARTMLPLGADTPPEQTPPDQTPPEQTHTPSREQTPPGSRLQHTVNERPVRILLECILVFLKIYSSTSN